MELMQPPLRDTKDLFRDWTVCSLWLPLPQSPVHNEDHPDRNDNESDADLDRRVVRIGNLYGRNNRFTRSHREPIPGVQRFNKDNLYRYALDDLHVVTCCILGREQTEPSSAAALDAIDKPRKFPARQRIHLDFDSLTGSHAAYLIFLEVRRDPDLLRHKREQVLTSLDVGSRLDRFLGDPA